MKHCISSPDFILSDANNNTDVQDEVPIINSFTRFVERLLFIIDNQYLITPNGGSGDCMFKAVCQAVHRGEEMKHTEVRKMVVEFIVRERWDKFKESIEVQHVSGNQHLAKKWKSNPIKAYQSYMSSSGTLGSSSELNAAGELFRYNFATIQEYTESTKKTYRVENCTPFDDPAVPFHYFFFTGDFDNGHWEFLEPVGNMFRNKSIPDGVYPGLVTVMIDGTQSTVDNWLKVHTDNTNDVFRLKHPSFRSRSKPSCYPFEWDQFQYDQDGFVPLLGGFYQINDNVHSDLFSVMASFIYENVNDNDVDRFEYKLLNYRISNFASLNHKIITQPHSHGFSVVNFKYLSMPSKGNIQDLLSAADLFSFSFQIFIKPTENGDVQACKFIHIDRWGGETDTVHTFFMRVFQPCEEHDEVFSRWWHLTPVVEDGPTSQQSEVAEDQNRNLSQIGDCCANDDEAEEAVTRPVTPERLSLHKQKATSKSLSSIDKISESKSSVQNHPTDSRSYSLPPKESSLTTFHTIQEKIKPKATEPLDPKQVDIIRKQRPFSQIHDSFRNGKRIDNLPQIQIGINPSDTRDVSENGMQGSRNIKTVVEMFDEKTNRRKKYVYNGFVTREKVLETLYLQGLIKKPRSDHRSEKKKKDLEQRESFITPTNRTSESVTKDSIRLVKTLEDLNRNEAIHQFDTTSHVPEEYDLKSKSASAIALVAEESIVRTNKFLQMHRRVAPDGVGGGRSKVERKGWFRRFLSWVALAFRFRNKKS